ncbi:MAG: 3-hydroxyisobutyrate dehydrogenase [Thalassobaculaceae bacterium]
MAKIGFIGLGNMGLPMAKNLINADHDVIGFDLLEECMSSLVDAGGRSGKQLGDCVLDVNVVITMLPEGKHVDAVYNNGILGAAAKDTLLIDCSTIDVDTARSVGGEAKKLGYNMVDAPVSGGTGGAEAGTLTFMVGGEEHTFNLAKPYLDIMGKNIVHAGGMGNGQAAKICNNMILGISMIAVSESFSMAEKLGLSAQNLFDITSSSSSQCWAMTSYLPVPGPVPASPANNDYQPGFTGAMMAKDMKLARDAAISSGQKTELADSALQMYERFLTEGGASQDFSAIYKMIHN